MLGTVRQNCLRKLPEESGVGPALQLDREGNLQAFYEQICQEIMPAPDPCPGANRARSPYRSRRTNGPCVRERLESTAPLNGTPGEMVGNSHGSTIKEKMS